MARALSAAATRRTTRRLSRALVCGLGMGLVVAPPFGFVLAGVDDDEVGSAAGVLNALQQLGAAVGVAVLGAICFSVLAGSGFLAGVARVLWVEAGLLAAAGVLALWLPMHPREDGLEG
ncbi:MAG: EmrB/QacA subfamily drug resistance transporter [Conexibacter sp.]|nr:EmrB/QacA subfamily drug resistance transporter [Conexibacter sp.]